MTSDECSLTMMILWIPLPKISTALVRLAVCGSVIKGSFFPRSLTSLSGIGLPSLPFCASSLKEDISEASGRARPTTSRR